MGLIDLLKDVPLSAVLKEKILALETENKSLKSEKTILDMKLAESEQQRRTLEQQISQIQHNPPLTFDSDFGAWVDQSTGMHYCTVCKTKFSRDDLPPLVKSSSGWRCPLCNLPHKQESTVAFGESKPQYY